jgi:hypothetical protein
MIPDLRNPAYDAINPRTRIRRAAPAAAEWSPMRKGLLACAALALLGVAPAATAGPSKVVHTPTPTPAAVSSGSKVVNKQLLLKIDAVTFVSPWTPCAPLPGYAQISGNGNLLGKDGNSVGFCGLASVRLKKTVATASLAGKAITIQVTEQHNNITPWETLVGSYTLPFPSSGDTLTYPRVAVGSFAGDNPAAATAEASNRRRETDADHMFSLGRPVLVELRNNGQTVDKRNCTFKTIPSPSGPGSAQITCP